MTGSSEIREEPKYIPDQQPKEQNVLPDIAQDAAILSVPSQKVQQRFTGKPKRSTDGVIILDEKELSAQSPKQVDIIQLGETGGENVVFHRTQDALEVAEQTGVDPRDYKTQQLKEAEDIDQSLVLGPQLSTVRKQRGGASRTHIPTGKIGTTRIKGLPVKK